MFYPVERRRTIAEQVGVGLVRLVGEEILLRHFVGVEAGRLRQFAVPPQRRLSRNGA